MDEITKFAKLQDVITQVLTNPTFAEDLRGKAAAAQVAGVDTDEWEALMVPFARNPEELALLRTLRSPDSEDPCTETTSFVLNIASTVQCTGTTTTTTTSFFCPDEETQLAVLSVRGRPKAKSKGQPPYKKPPTRKPRDRKS